MIFDNSLKNVYIALGSNLGNRIENFQAAQNAISKSIGEIKKTATIYTSKPQGYESENEYLNTVLLCESRLTAEEILQRLLAIEINLGRNENRNGYEDRPIDLDLLVINHLNNVLKTPFLTLPHPRIFDRSFVLIPLMEIAEKLLIKQIETFANQDRITLFKNELIVHKK